MPNVFLVGEFSEGALGLYYEREFVRAGWQTVRYDSWQGYTRGALLRRLRILRRAIRPLLWRVMSREVLAIARDENPDLVVVFKGAFLSASDVRNLKRAVDVPVVVVYPDNPYERYAQRSDMPLVLAEFDRTYIWGRFLLPILRKDGVRSVSYLPFAHDSSDYSPNLRSRMEECGKHHAVVFVGQWYPKREEWLEHLAGLDVGIWGGGWSRTKLARTPGFCIHRHSAHGAAAGAVYAQARVGLNVFHSSNLPAHNMRTFEIPPCRTVMVTEASEEVASFFPSGEACLAATTPSEFRNQVDRGLGDLSLAEAIAASGCQLAQQHTYAVRLKTILQELDFPTSPRFTSRVGI